MKRILTAILAVVPTFALAACTNSVGGNTGFTKDEARAAGGVDRQGHDICAMKGWYDDGECDDFCPQADGDCQASAECPSPYEPEVHYVGDHATCIAALWKCSEGQIPFGSEECGCGCIDVAEPGAACGGIAGLTCEKGLFCSYPLDAMCGAADQMGTCEPVPDACPGIYDPVCGCDGVTYSNACAASASGVSVAKEGECGSSGGTTCGGFAGLPCAKGELCNYPLDAMCGAADQTGTCEPIPQGCTKEYLPVCGCDGTTYSNACMANAAGVSVAKEGACDSGGTICGGFAGLPCAKGEFCNYPLDAMCGAGDQTGTCEIVPDVCVENYDPVCGCDGVTYSNACHANAAGVSVAKQGECGSSGTICGGFAGLPCAAGEFCNYPLDAMCGAADQTGTCEPMPGACTLQYDPVCGCDGVTYSNACAANAAGVSVAAMGECAATK